MHFNDHGHNMNITVTGKSDLPGLTLSSMEILSFNVNYKEILVTELILLLKLLQWTEDLPDLS